VKSWWLKHALTPKPQPSDTRPLFVRLVSSLKLVVRGSFQKGINFIGIRGNADF
jgi:hypothetical protein